MQGCWSPTQTWGFWFFRHVTRGGKGLCGSSSSGSTKESVSLCFDLAAYEASRKGTSGGLTLTWL